MTNVTLNLKKADVQTLLTTRRYLIFATAMVLIGVGILIFGVLAQVSTVYQLFSATNTERKTDQALQTKVKALQEVSYMNEFSKNDQVNLALPSEKPLLQLLSGVNNVAQQAGVSLSDIQTAPGKLASQSATVEAGGVAPTVDDTTTSVNGVNVLTISLKADGTLAQVNNFLDLIEKITPITQDTKLNLAIIPTAANATPISSASAGLDIYEADMELSTYYFSQDIAVTVDAPLPAIGTKEENFLNSLDTYQFPDYTTQQQVQGGGSSDLFNGSINPSPQP